MPRLPRLLLRVALRLVPDSCQLAAFAASMPARSR